MKSQRILTAVGLTFLAAPAHAQLGGPDPPSTMGQQFIGTGASDYDTNFANASWNTETIGNPCGSADPAPNGSVNSWHEDWWFLWKPQSPGNYVLDTCATTTTGGAPLTNYNTKIAVWDREAIIAAGTGMGNGFPQSGPYADGLLACGDDGPAAICADSSTRVTVAITAGQVASGLLIQCGGWSTLDVGPAVLTIEEATSMVGMPYCTAAPNSVSVGGASISATGSSSVMANDLVLSAGPIVPMEFGVFFHGDAATMFPFGEGSQCAGGGIVRIWPPSASDVTGTVTRPVDNTGPGGVGILAGATRRFQLWYRDPAGGPSGFNLSGGLAVTFTP